MEPARTEAGVDEVYQELQPLMFSIAYRMLGSATEAEDIVQEAFLRFHKETSGGTEVEAPKAYLSAVTTRLSIDHLRSARVRRERYVGTWLPEPILTEEEDDVALHAETADSLSMGFLVLLESLTPVERAVFLLREVFDYGFDEIARIVGKTEENCRQISVRARRHVHDAKPRFEASRARKEELARRFFAAAMDGDLDGLLQMLAAAAVARDRERCEDRHYHDHPDDRPDQRVTDWEAEHQPPRRVDDGRDGVPLREVLKPTGHRFRGHERRAHERERQDDQEPPRVDGLRRARRDPDQRHRPAHGEAERDHHDQRGDRLDGGPPEAEAQEQPEAGDQQDAPGHTESVRRDPTRDHGGARDRDRSEPLDHAALEVDVDRDRGRERQERDALHQDAWERELQIRLR